jgi:hypothetical protein
MCKVKEWRSFLSTNEKLIRIASATEGEQEVRGEEVDLQPLPRKWIKGKNATLKNTLVYPYEKGYDLVVGWDHAVVLRLVNDVWCIEAIFRPATEKGTVSFAPETKGVIEATIDDLHVVRFGIDVPIRRVTTYNATSCSVSVAFPAKTLDRLMLCHIDAKPPIPLPVMIRWCVKQDAKTLTSCSKEPPLWAVIASMCPGQDELAKFGKSVWIKEDTPVWDVETLALVRGSAASEKAAPPMENHTQFGLDLSGKQPLFGGFIGYPMVDQLGSLFPMDQFLLVHQLGANFDEDKATKDLLKPLIAHSYVGAFHTQCVIDLLAFHSKSQKTSTWSGCESYVRGVYAILNDPQDETYLPVFQSIMRQALTKLWMPLSYDQFAQYRA